VSGTGPGPDDPLDGFALGSFTHDDRTRDVYRIGTGPAVIVMSELPGITPRVAAFGRRVAGAGLTAVLPHLFGEPGRPPSMPYALATFARCCISRQFTMLATGRPSPITGWLRALAAEEHVRCGGPGVGAVGMCLTGGFALAMMVDDRVVAPVISQPSLPLPVGRTRRRDLGLGDTDLARVKERAAAGTCLLGLRFSGDPMSPGDRFDRLRAELGDRFIAVELDSSPGNPHGHPKAAHSVLTEHLQDEPGTVTRAALDQTLAFFADRLLEPAAT
jgi:dienelactone hydrolase